MGKYEKPLISVIVPIYNVEEYVEKCVMSIIAQSYRNLEIVLVDDGSTDNSGDICDAFAKDDSRVKVLHKANGGLSDARNYGIDEANGELLGFVDGDDRIHPRMYEVMQETMRANGADIVTCSFEQENEPSFLGQNVDDYHVKNMTGSEALCDIETPLVVAWNKLYKRRLFEGLRYPIGRLHEDEFIIHRVFRRCKTVSVIDKPLYYYTIRKGSIVATMSEKRINDALMAFMDRVTFSNEENWTEVMPSVVTRYCDYCIDRFYDIKSGRYEMRDEIMEMLWEKEHSMSECFASIEIDEKYRRFSISPLEYERYQKRKRRISYFESCLLKIANKVRGILRDDI